MDRGREWRGVSRRKFLRTAGASGIALSRAWRSLRNPGSLHVRPCRDGSSGTRPRLEPDASTASPRLRGLLLRVRFSRRRHAWLAVADFARAAAPGRGCDPCLRRSRFVAAQRNAGARRNRDCRRSRADGSPRSGVQDAGDLLCPVGKTPLYLGQPIALLVFEDFD